ncbi:sulfite reductase subunit alpha [Methylocapsa aurea]|uniref:sulfite reductase subunit alpha n=1 Tax=Methylocapsa aurea TaxID=663610 RepID=UPI00056D6DBC|nr:sulfite reductase subunit alpha [Methylocapsa aurea]
MNAISRSSAIAPIIPETAPFSPEQRGWLNGFFAGLTALDGAPATAVPANESEPPLSAPDDDGAPWHDQTLPLPERMKLAADRPMRRRMMAAMAQQDCGQCGYNCEDYANAIAAQAEDRLNLCAPGAKETARMLKGLVEEMGGGAIDPDEAKLKAETKAMAQSRDADQRPGRSRNAPAQAIFASRKRLNREGSEKATYHVEFDISGAGLDYEVGDSFGVFPRNDPGLVDRVIAAIGAPEDFPVADKTLRRVLMEDVSLGAAPDMLFSLISYITGGPRRAKAKALAKGEDPDGDAATLDVLAALEKFAGLRPDPEAFVEALEPLQPRLYSIASSLKANPGRVSLCVDQVRYSIAGRERLGVASTFLAAGLQPGAPVKAYVQRAHAFAPPADGKTPIIMVGPGTGVAPFRAFLQERVATKAQGPAWLFFGHQRRDADYFYEDEMSGFLAAGTLAKISLAWSRDGERKVYVQDKMREEASELWSWLSQGAHFYVCGDAKRMAADVEAALLTICAEYGGMNAAAAKAFLKELRAGGRYQTDVY